MNRHVEKDRDGAVAYLQRELVAVVRIVVIRVLEVRGRNECQQAAVPVKLEPFGVVTVENRVRQGVPVRIAGVEVVNEGLVLGYAEVAVALKLRGRVRGGGLTEYLFHFRSGDHTVPNPKIIHPTLEPRSVILRTIAQAKIVGGVGHDFSRPTNARHLGLELSVMVEFEVGLSEMTAPGKSQMLPEKFRRLVIVGYAGSGKSSLSDQPGHGVVDAETPVSGRCRTLGDYVSAPVVIQLYPSGKTEGADIIQLGGSLKRDEIIDAVESKGSAYSPA